MKVGLAIAVLTLLAIVALPVVVFTAITGGGSAVTAGVTGVAGIPATALVEHPAGRSDERAALPILDVAWLLTDQHHPGPRRPLTEDGLGGVLPEVAGLAGLGGSAELFEAGAGRDGGHRREGYPASDSSNRVENA